MSSAGCKSLTAKLARLTVGPCFFIATRPSALGIKAHQHGPVQKLSYNIKTSRDIPAFGVMPSQNVLSPVSLPSASDGRTSFSKQSCAAGLRLFNEALVGDYVLPLDFGGFRRNYSPEFVIAGHGLAF